MQVRRHPHFRVICAARVILSISGSLRWLAPGSVSGSKMRYTKLAANGPEVSIVCLVRQLWLRCQAPMAAARCPPCRRRRLQHHI